jgi:hypothetical protein
MEIKRTYWRNAYNNQFKPELAENIGNFIIQKGDRQKDGSISFVLEDEIELPTSDGIVINVKTINTTIKNRRYSGIESLDPDKVVMVFQESNVPIEYLTVDSMMLLLDAIDQQVFPVDFRSPIFQCL